MDFDEECGPDCPQEYGLVLPFLSSSPQFVYGWEAHRVWASMCAEEALIDGFFHSENDEQLLLMASRKGYSVEMERVEHQPEWTRLTFALSNTEP